MAVEFLYTPSEFYSRLLSLVGSAKNRVSIATLYIGSGDMEMKLLQTVQRLPNGVEVRFLVDGLRGNRKGGDSPIQFLREHCARAQVREYVSPHYAGFARLLPDRIREIVGTQHMKIVAVDDTVLITGANMSDIYFTNRQDRYMIIHDCHSLADDMHDIVREFPNHATARQRGNIDQETVVEFGTHRENEPDRVALDLLARTPSDSVIRLCSPYLNLSRDLLHALSKFAHVEIIAGSANANGFYKSKGLSGLIPEAYEILKEDIGNQISLFEYSRSGWTFHTKGIWISPATCEMPHSTIIGSSNFSIRSHFRDTEISFAVKSSNPGVQESMRAELDDVLKYVHRSSPGQVKTPLLRYLVKGPLKTFL